MFVFTCRSYWFIRLSFNASELPLHAFHVEYFCACSSIQVVYANFCFYKKDVQFPYCLVSQGNMSKPTTTTTEWKPFLVHSNTCIFPYMSELIVEVHFIPGHLCAGIIYSNFTSKVWLTLPVVCCSAHISYLKVFLNYW